MLDDDLRYGVVGCAGMGTNHADGVRAADGATLAACADVVEGYAREFAESYDVEPYRDPAEMAVEADLDAVSVCTPNGTHADIVEELAAAGVDVLCEKPLDVTPDRVDRMVDACEREGVLLAGIFQRRTLGGARLTNDAVADGRLGDVILGDVQVKWHRKPSYYEEASWRGTADLDGGILLTQALHGIDLLQWIVGDVVRVAADLKTLHHDVDVPDTAVASLEFADGTMGTVSASTAVYPQSPITVQVHGTEGTIRWHEDAIDEYTTVDGPDEVEPTDFPLGRGITGQVRDFVRALREDREPMVPAAEARRALDVVFAATAATEREEWVDVSEFRDGRG